MGVLPTPSRAVDIIANGQQKCLSWHNHDASPAGHAPSSRLPCAALVPLYPMVFDIIALPLHEFAAKYAPDVDPRMLVGRKKAADSDPTVPAVDSLVEIAFWADWHRGHELHFQV